MSVSLVPASASDQIEWRYLYSGGVKHALRLIDGIVRQNQGAVCSRIPVWFDGRGWRGDLPTEKPRLKILPRCKACCTKLGLHRPPEERLPMTPGQARRAQRVYEGLQVVKPGEVLLFQKDNGERVLLVVAAVPEESLAAEATANAKKLAMRGGPPDSHILPPSQDLLLPTEETVSA